MTDTERELVEMLGKAADTFHELAVALEFLNRKLLAKACRVAEVGCRDAIRRAQRAAA